MFIWVMRVTLTDYESEVCCCESCAWFYASVKANIRGVYDSREVVWKKCQISIESHTYLNLLLVDQDFAIKKVFFVILIFLWALGHFWSLVFKFWVKKGIEGHSKLSSSAFERYSWGWTGTYWRTFWWCRGINDEIHILWMKCK